MGLYNINFIQKAVELLPPDKRMPKFVYWVYSLLKPSEYNNNRLFDDYKVGAVYPIYVPATYNVGDIVIYGQSVYVSLTNGNTALPTDTNNWRVYQDNFIGVDERILYNHQKLVLEWALNRRFNTTFRQPPLIPDIYIQKNLKPVSVFVVGEIEEESSIVYDDISSEFIIDAYTFGTYRNFTIWIPLAVYNGLSNDPAARDKVVRNFVDLYNTIGCSYNIQTY